MQIFNMSETDTVWEWSYIDSNSAILHLENQQTSVSLLASVVISSV